MNCDNRVLLGAQLAAWEMVSAQVAVAATERRALIAALQRIAEMPNQPRAFEVCQAIARAALQEVK